MRRFSIALALLALLFTRKAEAQAYKIIVNEANAVGALSRVEVAQLFMKKKSAWASGAPVTPVEQGASSPARVAFSQEVFGKDVNGMKLYWQQQVFSGRATAPEEKGSDAAVVSFVKENPGAIGYVSAAASVAGVKVLSVH